MGLDSEVYWEVGKALIDQGSPDPLYERWIETYGGEAPRLRDLIAPLARRLQPKSLGDQDLAQRVLGRVPEGAARKDCKATHP